MQYWMALLVAPRSQSQALDARLPLGWWALQFTPRVALYDDAVVLELSTSQRLFGGEAALRERVRKEALDMGCTAVAWAPTSTGAVALARCGETDGFAAPLAHTLDRLPLIALPEVAAEAHTLLRLGCKTLGDVRRLPRGGLSRRFGKRLLQALDGAYGLRPHVHEWLSAPEVFDARLELPGHIELADALLFGARRLLLQMSGWLAARHAGVRSFRLRWKYDSHRGRNAPDHDEITIHTAEATRQIDHFLRLLAERLAKTRLAAPVDEIFVHAQNAEPLEEMSASLLQEKTHGGESVTQLIERLSARLGPDKVLRAVLRPDYRPEWVQAWQPATQPLPRGGTALPDMPQPTWLLTQPLRLALKSERPLYQGPLAQVCGPHRVEAGWWDRTAAASADSSLVRRDYYVMFNEHAGLLWVYRELDVGEDRGSPWYLHGVFG
ncbi:MAG: DNA polymerase Y family protein [Burkholderiaceae bacterium]|nr:DNA polymerase Y family protein [Burkholderiaceae bacterium]